MKWPERVALVAVPLIANVVLAVFLSTQIQPGNGEDPAASPASAGPRPGGRSGLPNRSLERIVRQTRESTGSDYVCDGPWQNPAEGTMTWACRTREALALVTGTGPEAIGSLHVTWFGFEPARTDLPAWAAAVLGDHERAEFVQSWVQSHLGDEAATTIGTWKVTVGGARGALTFSVSPS